MLCYAANIPLFPNIFFALRTSTDGESLTSNLFHCFIILNIRGLSLAAGLKLLKIYFLPFK